MREIEKIFRAIRCAEEDKVSLATYMLQEVQNVLKGKSVVNPSQSLHPNMGAIHIETPQDPMVRVEGSRKGEDKI
ncbi:hypothetical protein Taro_009918 [Colocasia esculenta]|uniref:Uncharacterized protein n=1 Tax=Colocasia esculenta TaxID=4460 RepID=A0A843U703_COLES|nr:hypothetical protein [Colocasia esculenta]